MSKYVENNLNRNETIVKKADISKLSLIPTWIGGILFCWLLLIPLVKAIVNTIKLFNIELAITSRRVIGKFGVVNSAAMDAPLDKVQNCSVSSGLGGKIFGYGTVVIDTAAGKYIFTMVKQPDNFKKALMAQIEQAQEDKMKAQAEEMAKAMAAAIKQ
jgi:uncharacterized membrane protein YdbT with pleckstrin-like domain